MNKLHRLLALVLGAPEEINGSGKFDTYLYRWFLFRSRWGNLYIHNFVGDDGWRDMHDHPKTFISLMIWGSYWEETPATSPDAPEGIHDLIQYKALSLRMFRANHIHRITDPKKCWTLVAVGPKLREWGFWSKGKWIAWNRYVKGERNG